MEEKSFTAKQKGEDGLVFPWVLHQFTQFPADGGTEGDAQAPATTHRRDSPGYVLPSRISVPIPHACSFTRRL